MENRPLFLGRGRGRGRAQNQLNDNRKTSEWNRKLAPKETRNEVTTVASDERLKAVDKIKESLKKYIGDEYEDSSSDEEVNDAEILSNTFKCYEKNSSHGKTDFFTA